LARSVGRFFIIFFKVAIQITITKPSYNKGLQRIDRPTVKNNIVGCCTPSTAFFLDYSFVTRCISKYNGFFFLYLFNMVVSPVGQMITSSIYTALLLKTARLKNFF
jgi:hypothetical protein